MCLGRFGQHVLLGTANGSVRCLPLLLSTAAGLGWARRLSASFCWVSPMGLCDWGGFWGGFFHCVRQLFRFKRGVVQIGVPYINSTLHRKESVFVRCCFV